MSTTLNNSLLKGFDILRLISAARPEVTAAVVADELRMNFATAHRFLTTLQEAGALVAVRRGVYRLSLATAEIGRLAELTNPLVASVQPLIGQLCADLGESVMACRLARAGPVCVAVALADRPITVSIRVGTTLDLVGSAQGRLWLAAMTPGDRAAIIARSSARATGHHQAADPDWLNHSLAAIRQTGVARNLGNVEPEIAAVAASVRGTGGAVLLTISVFGPIGRFTPDFLAVAEARVLAVARQIEAGQRL